MSIIDIFRESIDNTISEIVNALKNGENLDVRMKCADTLSKLSEKGTPQISSDPALPIDNRRSLIGMAVPEIVDLLKESHGDACRAYTYAVAKLSEQGNRANLLEPGSIVLTTIIAEFRAVIAPAIPGIVNLLKDDDLRIHVACADTLSTLSERGKSGNLSGPTLLTGMTLKAEFRPLIEPAIPGIVNFLKSSEWKVRSAGTNALSKLSEQGETANFSGQALLMNSQLNFDLQLAPPFLRLLTCSSTVARAFVRQVQILCCNFQNKVKQPSYRTLLC
jgi:uncharacterized protein (UPF0147 family)